MMNGAGLFRMEIRQPTKSIPQRPALLLRLAQMLMRPLQRGQRESVRRNQLRFTQRVPLARAVTVQRNQEWRGLHRTDDYVVVQASLSAQCPFDWLCITGCGFIHRVAYNTVNATDRNTLCIRPR